MKENVIQYVRLLNNLKIKSAKKILVELFFDATDFLTLNLNIFFDTSNFLKYPSRFLGGFVR